MCGPDIVFEEMRGMQEQRLIYTGWGWVGELAHEPNLNSQ